MSFFLTQKQLLDGSKTVTRRLGWKNIRRGEFICAIEKGQGLKKGEKIKRLGVIEIVSVRLEPLNFILGKSYGEFEVVREGFPNKTPEQFVVFFCKSHKGCTPSSIIKRIEFRIAGS